MRKELKAQNNISLKEFLVIYLLITCGFIEENFNFLIESICLGLYIYVYIYIINIYLKY